LYHLYHLFSILYLKREKKILKINKVCKKGGKGGKFCNTNVAKSPQTTGSVEFASFATLALQLHPILQHNCCKNSHF